MVYIQYIYKYNIYIYIEIYRWFSSQPCLIFKGYTPEFFLGQPSPCILFMLFSCLGFQLGVLDGCFWGCVLDFLWIFRFGENLTCFNKCKQQNTTEPLHEWLLQTIPKTVAWFANGTTLGHVVIRDGRFQASLEPAIWGSWRSALFQGCVWCLAKLLGRRGRCRFLLWLQTACSGLFWQMILKNVYLIVQLEMRVMNLDITMNT